MVDPLNDDEKRPVRGADEQDRKVELAINEYKLLQHHLGLYRNASMNIKNWSVTVFVAALATAYSQHEPLLLLLATGSAVIFWMMDARWLLYGESFNSRAKEIEDHFVQGDQNYVGPQIERACIAHRDAVRSKPFTARFMMRPSIHMPHSLLFLVGVVATVLTAFGVVKV